MRRKAQQLIEFAFCVPILMIILFIIIEFGNALNARMTLSEGVKMALMKVNTINNLNGDAATKEAAVKAFIKNEVTAYLIQHNIPNSASVAVEVKADNDAAGVWVRYNYNPYFLFPALLGGSFPDAITFSSSQTINPHILKPNIFPGTPYTTEELSNFHTDAFGNPIETGTIIDGDIYGDGLYNVRDHTVFLLHFYGGLGTHPDLEYDYARLISWQGIDILPPNLRINLKTANLEVRSPYYRRGQWFDTNIPYVYVLQNMDINHVIYVKYNSFDMYLPEDSGFMYKLAFGKSWPGMLNRGIRFCGQTEVGTGTPDLSTGDCYGDLRGTGTVNERALRMNPRLGNVTSDPKSGNNSYVIGSMEPIVIEGNPNHHMNFVRSPYFTIRFPLYNYDRTSIQKLLTVASPYIAGVGGFMPEDLYHPDIMKKYQSAFYQNNIAAFMIYEEDDDDNPGESTNFLPAGIPFDKNALDADIAGVPGNMDPIEIVNDVEFFATILDVYIDSDTDGIPDAWDRDPAYFDANVNGILDGNEPVGLDLNTEVRCNDGMYDPLDYVADNAICNNYPDVIDNGSTVAGHVVNGGVDFQNKHMFNDPASGIEIDYYANPPYRIGGVRANPLPNLMVPELRTIPYTKFVFSAGDALYYYIPWEDRYRRRYPTWWNINGSPNHEFSDAVLTERAERQLNPTPFIYASLTDSNGNGLVDQIWPNRPSSEWLYLRDQNIFSPNSRIYRTPATDW